jgi:hypothetical protein
VILCLCLEALNVLELSFVLMGSKQRRRLPLQMLLIVRGCGHMRLLFLGVDGREGQLAVQDSRFASSCDSFTRLDDSWDGVDGVPSRLITT